MFYNVSIDHFTNHGNGSETYAMRYIIDKTYWNVTSGPILFYCGNEGDAWTFYNNSGFMTTSLAKKLSALVVVGEHRYFGKS